MALAVPAGQGRYVPQPSRTFLGACVDELLEQREHPWDPARLHRESVEQRLTAFEQTLNAMQRQLTEALARAAAVAKPRSLSPAKHNIQQVLEAMPPEDLGSRQTKAIVAAVQAEIDAKYGGVGRSPSTIKLVLAGFRPSRRRQSPRCPRTNADH
jgi:hypothetical protein